MISKSQLNQDINVVTHYKEKQNMIEKIYQFINNDN